ncbi:MAG: DUF3793 family protein [Suipraeoptans sp.]
MSQTSIYEMLSNEDAHESVSSKIVLQCAPFLKGLKVSAIINVNQGECKVLRSIISDTDISFYKLSSSEDKCLLFLYRRKEFTAYLESSEVREFIQPYGYELKSFGTILFRLRERVSDFKQKRMGFPHEIGIFLDYPIEDVKGYIEDKGKNSLLTGYWQVYHNPEKAKATFNKYNQARKKAVQEYLNGKALKEITC